MAKQSRHIGPVNAALEFLGVFAAHLRQAGISFAITSGMACVRFGLQQTTKDSDWIIAAEDLEKLRALLQQLEGKFPPWRISYRQICGAPLEAEYMGHGWTSHLSLWDTAGSLEHKVDIFSRPPRVKPGELVADADGWAGAHVVAQMKKTDRDKDWPMVNGLGQRLWRAQSPLGLLHITHLDSLVSAWDTLAEAERAALARRRPLLQCLSRAPMPPRGHLEFLLLLERLIWTRVNEHRHRCYARAWKDFYRRWRQEEDWLWPTNEAFQAQHEQLRTAARKHGLPFNPLAAQGGEKLVQAALTEILAMERFTQNDIDLVLPPLDELIP